MGEGACSATNTSLQLYVSGGGILRFSKDFFCARENNFVFFLCTPSGACAILSEDQNLGGVGGVFSDALRVFKDGGMSNLK